ncbi:MAG: hypothetical protein ACLFTL_10220 [Alphaproteobacteria bacterium]
MTATDPVDEARLGLLLGELRLPALEHIWSRFAERADKEGWPAARFLVTLAEHELAERDPAHLRHRMRPAEGGIGALTPTRPDDPAPRARCHVIATAASRQCHPSWLPSMHSR